MPSNLTVDSPRQATGTCWKRLPPDRSAARHHLARDHELLRELPNSLLVSLQQSIHERLIRSVHWLDASDEASAQLVSRLLLSMEQHVFAPDDMLICEAEIGSSAFFLETGRVHVSTAEVSVMFIDAPTVLGEVALLKNTNRTASVVAVSVCDVLELSRRAFDTAVLYFPQVLPRLSVSLNN
jgi:CRP-like cAMP-binding protein